MSVSFVTGKCGLRRFGIEINLQVSILEFVSIGQQQ
jgi:hypothetical protein